MNAAEQNLDNAVNAVEDNPMDVDASDLWDKLRSQIYRVIDEEGVNVEGAQVRHLCGNYWLYCSDSQGYLTLEEEEVESLLCVREESHRPCGWDRAGNVVEL